MKESITQITDSERAEILELMKTLTNRLEVFKGYAKDYQAGHREPGCGLPVLGVLQTLDVIRHFANELATSMKTAHGIN